MVGSVETPGGDFVDLLMSVFACVIICVDRPKHSDVDKL